LATEKPHDAVYQLQMLLRIKVAKSYPVALHKCTHCLLNILFFLILNSNDYNKLKDIFNVTKLHGASPD